MKSKTSNALTPYVERYLNSLKHARRSKNTTDTYGGILYSASAIMCKLFSIQSIEDVRGYMVEAVVQSFGEISVQTQNYYISVLKLFFGYLEEAGYINHNPSSVLKKTKVIIDDSPVEEEVDNKAYSEGELLSIVRACKGALGDRDKAIVSLLSGSGLRASELCSLNISSWNNRTNGHIYVKRKGGAYRWVAVAEYVVPYIENYLSTREFANANDPLFVTVNGNRLSRQELYRILKRRQTAAQTESGVHIFRHTFLTGTSKTSNIRVAQLLANHRDENTTRGYIHTTSDERKQAVNSTSWATQMEQLASQEY